MDTNNDKLRDSLATLYLLLQEQQLDVSDCYDDVERTYRVGWNHGIGNALRELRPLLLPAPTYSCRVDPVEMGLAELVRNAEGGDDAAKLSRHLDPYNGKSQ